MSFPVRSSQHSTRCEVQTNQNRTLWYDENVTIGEAIADAERRGYSVSLTRTFRQYGLQFTNLKAFVSKYAPLFQLGDSKTLNDVKLKELRVYKEQFLGFRLKGV